MSDRDEEIMIEELAGAFRPSDPRELAYLPVFYDLSEEAREQAFEVALRQRRLEAALDASGQSSTVKAVLGRLKRA